MSTRRLNLAGQLDWPTILTVMVLVLLGWLNIVSATAEAEVVWDMGGKAGKQLIWMGVCSVLMVGLLAIEGEFYIRTSVLHYLGVLLLLAPSWWWAKKWGVPGRGLAWAALAFSPVNLPKPPPPLWWLGSSAETEDPGAPWPPVCHMNDSIM